MSWRAIPADDTSEAELSRASAPSRQVAASRTRGKTSFCCGLQASAAGTEPHVGLSQLSIVPRCRRP
eukprot:2441544-Alexandrium_andersonii.AAC.1